VKSEYLFTIYGGVIGPNMAYLIIISTKVRIWAFFKIKKKKKKTLIKAQMLKKPNDPINSSKTHNPQNTAGRRQRIAKIFRFSDYYQKKQTKKPIILDGSRLKQGRTNIKSHSIIIFVIKAT
jgi:hypothetical protein